MTSYYNEFDPFAAAWLKELIADGLIAPGDVDTRSIKDVQPDDLKGYQQCHFFAGIGGWSLALRQAGWTDDRSVWTGSCPCQPFSVAGAQEGFSDSRHLWPEFRRLIAERCPAIVFGEQVANATAWLALVRSDLEAMGYAVGAIPIEAASAGAQHKRDRLWFVADHDQQRQGDGSLQPGGQQRRTGGDPEDHPWPVLDVESVGWGKGWTEPELRSRGLSAAVADIGDCQVIECPDGKWRRLPPPGVRWLGIGLSARVDKLRAIGNAIDWRPAAAFIQAADEAIRG